MAFAISFACVLKRLTDTLVSIVSDNALALIAHKSKLEMIMTNIYA